MEQKRNYQKELEKRILEIQKAETVPTLFLHSCCAPCSSYVLEYLSKYFKITVFYYNPNISAKEEYEKRVQEEQRFIKEMNEIGNGNAIQFLEGDYLPELFFKKTKGLENCKEGGERCFLCYALRLGETVAQAEERGYDYVATTLTISPLKNASKLNEIGAHFCEGKTVNWLYSDFKKKGGYQRSIELSKEFHLYRQDYCGCVFSKLERECQKREKEEEDERKGML